MCYTHFRPLGFTRDEAAALLAKMFATADHSDRSNLRSTLRCNICYFSIRVGDDYHDDVPSSLVLAEHLWKKHGVDIRGVNTPAEKLSRSAQ
jgi:hypothetical protein